MCNSHNIIVIMVHQPLISPLESISVGDVIQRQTTETSQMNLKHQQITWASKV